MSILSQKPRIALCTLLVVLGTTSVVGAQSADPSARAAARDLGYEGVKAYQANDYVTASERLTRAYQVLKAPSLGLWLGRSLRDQGKLVEASELFLEVTRLPLSGGDETVQQQAQKDAAKDRDALQSRIAKLAIVLAGPNSSNATVTVDGRQVQSALLGVASPINPGKHVVVANGADGTVVSREVTLTEGGNQTVTLELKETATAVAPALATTAIPVTPVASATTSTPTASNNATPANAEVTATSKPAVPRWIGYTALAVGGVGFVAGTAFGLKARSDLKTLRDSDNCNSDNKCSLAASDAVDNYNRQRANAFAGFGVGALGLVSGVVLLWVLPDSKTQEKPVAIDLITTRRSQQVTVRMAF